MLLFLKLYLTHLFVSFINKLEFIARNKTKASSLIVHFVIYAVVALLVVNVDLNRQVLLALLVLGVTHATCDYVAARYSRREWFAFALRQLVPLILIFLTITLFVSDFSRATALVKSALVSQKVFMFVSVYILIVLGGGYLVQKVTKYFMDQIDPNLVPSKPGLPNAGKYIGWLERFLVLTFIITGYPDGIGFLLAGKALVRYPEIKDDAKGHFAEYFLIGTLSSVTLALVAGFLLVKLTTILSS